MGSLIEKIKKKKIYLWGAGQVCRLFIQRFKKELDIQGIIDDNPQMCGKLFCGYDVIPSPIIDDDSCKLDGKTFRKMDVIFILLINFYRKKRKELELLGYENYIPPEICTEKKKMSDLWQQMYFMHPPLSKANMENVARLKAILSDDESRRVVDSIIENRASGSMDYWKFQSRHRQYFEPEIMTFSERETIIDCGAFVGDTVKEWADLPVHWERVVCFEPGDENYEELVKNVAIYPNVEAIHAAAGDLDGTVYFSDEGEAWAKVTATGAPVPCRRIDSLGLNNLTLIKADVEGSELAVLDGAKESICRFRPKLAICIYHKPNDLWEIPLKVKELVPDYDIFIRHYGDVAGDTVMYARLSK